MLVGQRHASRYRLAPPPGRQRIGSTAPGAPDGDHDLVHDPARRPDHVVLRLLAQRREPQRVDAVGAERARGRDLERGARRHTDRLRDVGRHREACPRRLDHPWRTSTSATPSDVVRPLREVDRARRASSGIRRARASFATSSTVSVTGPTTSASSGSATTVVARLRRHLEHERAGVVGDAAEQVEAAGRATGRRVHRRARRGRDRCGPRARRSRSPPTRPTSSCRGCVERRAARIGDDTAHLLQQHRGADVVGMARERVREPTSGRRSATKRSWPAMSSWSWPPDEMYSSSNTCAVPSRGTAPPRARPAPACPARRTCEPAEAVLEVGGRRRPHGQRRPRRRRAGRRAPPQRRRPGAAELVGRRPAWPSAARSSPRRRRRASEPPRGAAAARHHAGRLSYISPRCRRCCRR